VTAMVAVVAVELRLHQLPSAAVVRTWSGRRTSATDAVHPGESPQGMGAMDDHERQTAPKDRRTHHKMQLHEELFRLGVPQRPEFAVLAVNFATWNLSEHVRETRHGRCRSGQGLVYLEGDRLVGLGCDDQVLPVSIRNVDLRIAGIVSKDCQRRGERKHIHAARTSS
jgi:hypothetical protein